MSRSVLSKLDLINLALMKTGKARTNDLENDRTDDVDNALLAYKARHQKLMSLFPWGFARKAARMDRRDARDGEGRAYGMKWRYLIPADAVLVWDIYPSPGYAREFSDDWDRRWHPRIAATSLPYLTSDRARLLIDDTVGRIYRDGVYSNWDTLYCVYTTNEENRAEDFSAPFAAMMENMMEELLQKGRQTDGETMSRIESSNRRDDAMMLGKQSIENRHEMDTVGETEAVRNMRDWMP